MDQQFALVSGCEFDHVAQAIRRPQCSACGYEAPLPTLKQFDGLCLGCYEELFEREMAAADEQWAATHGLTTD